MPELPKKGKPLDYLPGVHERPKRKAKAAEAAPTDEEVIPLVKKKRKKTPITSESKMNASVAGEIEPKEEEAPYEEMTVTEGPTASQQEAMDREGLRNKAIELHDGFQDAQAEFDRVQAHTAKRAKEIAEQLSGKGYDADTILYLTDAINSKEGLNEMYDAALDKLSAARTAYETAYGDWERAMPKKESADMNEVVERIAQEARPFTAQEDAWFKQGEDASHLKAQAELQEMEDLRKGIAGSYDESKQEVIVDDQASIDAAVREAEDMLRKDELHSDLFNVRDYEYLLTQQARLDRELETAGWWAARKLRAEQAEVRKSLDDYEEQKRKVLSGRTPSDTLTAKEKEDIRYKGPSKDRAPQGSGTSVHANKKPGFFARLFGRK